MTLTPPYNSAAFLQTTWFGLNTAEHSDWRRCNRIVVRKMWWCCTFSCAWAAVFTCVHYSGAWCESFSARFDLVWVFSPFGEEVFSFESNFTPEIFSLVSFFTAVLSIFRTSEHFEAPAVTVFGHDGLEPASLEKIHAGCWNISSKFVLSSILDHYFFIAPVRVGCHLSSGPPRLHSVIPNINFWAQMTNWWILHIWCRVVNKV